MGEIGGMPLSTIALTDGVAVLFVGSGGLRGSSSGSITAISTLSSVANSAEPKLEGVPMKLDGRGRGTASATPLLAEPFST